MKTYKIADIDLIIYDGDLGIRLSGGTDSAILLYYMAKYSSNNLYAYVLSEKKSDYSTELLAQRTIDKIKELTGNNNIILRVVRVESKNKYNLRAEFAKAADQDNITMMYTGISKRPPAIDELKFGIAYGGDDGSWRDPDLKVDTIYDYHKVYVPLANNNKKDIKRMYDYDNVLESLAPSTFSCTRGEDKRIACGKCWWCKEREWAFGDL